VRYQKRHYETIDQDQVLAVFRESGARGVMSFFGVSVGTAYKWLREARAEIRAKAGHRTQTCGGVRLTKTDAS